MNANIPKMFKAYDLRGTPPDLCPEVYYWTGYAFVEKILKPAGLPLEVVIGHDCRLTSREFTVALVKGIEDGGAKSHCIGQVPTDILYSAAQLYDIAGIMVTASHNPSQYNGAKFVKEKCSMIGVGSGLELIRDYVVEHMGTNMPSLPPKYQIDEKYLAAANDFIVQCMGKLLDQKNDKKLRVGVDAGNGMGGYYLTHLKKMFPLVEWNEIFTEPDGNFPNHMPDPTKPENIAALQQLVVEKQLDFGVTFDGDADRAYFIDEKGGFVDGNWISALISKTLLKQHAEKPMGDLTSSVVYNFPGSRVIPNTILESGGAAIPAKMGHTFIKKEMVKYKSVFGCEHSGHYYYGIFGGFDSGVLTLTVMMNLMLATEAGFSALFTPYNKLYSWSGELNYPRDASKQISDFENALYTNFPDAHYSTLDGISMFYPDWKLNIRFSNTEPLVRISIETIGENKIAEKQKLIQDLFQLPEIAASSH